MLLSGLAEWAVHSNLKNRQTETAIPAITLHYKSVSYNLSVVQAV